jgi:glycosyltransferase involved in cell wall biosynthesis
MNPLVSICCVTYNHENYIHDAIKGFLIQKTNFPFEIIIHDDASTDSTASIIREYEKQYPELIVCIYQTENQYSKGIRMFSIPISHSKGKYMALCEGDDYWTDPYKLQKQVELLEKNPHCIMCVAKTEVRKNNELIMIFGEGHKDEYNIYDILNGSYFHTSTYLIKNKNIEQCLSTNTHIPRGDTSLRYLLSDLGPFILLNEVVSVYRITGNGVWTSLNNTDQIKLHINLHKSFHKYFKPKYRLDFAKLLISDYFQLFVGSIKKFNLKEIFTSGISLFVEGVKHPKHFSLFLIQKFKSFRFNRKLRK